MPTERTQDRVLSQMATLAKCKTKAEATRYSTKTGVRSTHSLLTGLPGFDIVKMRPQDLTHLEVCGLLRDEATGIVHHCTKVKKYFTLGQYHNRVKAYGPPAPIPTPVPVPAWASLSSADASMLAELPSFTPSCASFLTSIPASSSPMRTARPSTPSA